MSLFSDLILQSLKVNGKIFRHREAGFVLNESDSTFYFRNLFYLFRIEFFFVLSTEIEGIVETVRRISRRIASIHTYLRQGRARGGI